ncbi:MAG: type II secretion system protein [Planctomycetota bacterium]
MGARRGLTLAEVLVTLVIVAVVALGVIWLAWRAAAAREEARRIRCRGNLNQLAKGMATYLVEHGDNRFYPYPIGRGTRPHTFNGAEWLAALYWTDIVPDSGVFICPSSPDPWNRGRDFGAVRAAPSFGSATISYAGMHHRCGEEQGAPRGSGHRDWSFDLPFGALRGCRVATDQAGRPTRGAVRDDYPPNLPMASDDTQGAINHRWPRPAGMSVLFFDSHVEFWAEPQIDPAAAVGRKPGPLWLLSN